MNCKDVPLRSCVDKAACWRLEDIYASNELWEQDFQQLQTEIRSIRDLQGTVTSAENLLHCLLRLESVGVITEKLVGYAAMRCDEDNSSSTYQNFKDRAVRAQVQLEEAAAFFEPELLQRSEAELEQWLAQESDLEEFRHYLWNILRRQPHTLPLEQEQLLAAVGEIAAAPAKIFGMFNNADLRFPDVENEAGEALPLSHGRYVQFLESPLREVREAAFKTMHNTFAQWQNTLTASFSGTVKQAAFFAQARSYSSARAMALNESNIPEAVYDSLIDAVNESLPNFHRYMDLRRQLLLVPELHMWDLHVPLSEVGEPSFSKEEAAAMVCDGLSVLGSKYVRTARAGIENGWVDWFENKGKTSGAYSWGPYGVHPYILMNFNGGMDDVLTLAHEMGHAMHSHYSFNHQRYINAGYSIFAAEVASTVNEFLLIHKLLEQASEPQVRLNLYNRLLDQFRGTVYRQTMFAEFERDMHQQAAGGDPLTAAGLQSYYQQLNGRYHGPNVVNDPEIAAEWSRIPHFYRPFYVYQYATGFCAAVALGRGILRDGQPALDRYLDFLRAGGSDYPIAALAKAGVDMTCREPVAEALSFFAESIAAMERTAAES